MRFLTAKIITILRNSTCALLLCSLSACSSTSPDISTSEIQNTKQKQQDRDIYPSFKEVVTLGLVSDADDEEQAAMKEAFSKIYVTKEEDRRNFLEKTLNVLSLGLLFTPERKEEYAARIAQEQRMKELYVSPEDDDRGILMKSSYWLTENEIAAPETKEQRELRLAREKAEKNKPVYDNRSLFEFGVGVTTAGMWQPGAPKPYVPKNAIGQEDPLRQLVYGLSTYEDAVNVLGAPVKSTRYADGRIDATFVSKPESYARVPYVGSPRKTISFNFSDKGLLEDPKIQAQIEAQSK